MKKLVLFIFLVISGGVTFAQDSTLQELTKGHATRIIFDEDKYLDVNLYLQWWNVVTLDYAGQDLSPRYDMFIRRGRLGVQGKIAKKVFYQTSFAYDGVGKDSLTQAAGIPNQEDNTTFFPRDIFIAYFAHPLLNITVGYFRPKAGKESIYSSSFGISQEKSWASFQPRIHILGRGIGRETGINIGGLYTRDKSGVLYDIGIFDPNHPLIIGDNSIWSPMFSGRVVAYIGDPEYKEYPVAYKQSGYGERKGLSVGVNGTYQKETVRFKNNSLLGVDAQLNYKSIDFLVEYNWLLRDSKRDGMSDITTSDEFLTLKLASNFKLKNETILQPTIMYSNVMVDPMFTNHLNPYTEAISQDVIGVGMNWLIHYDKLKLGLHYYKGDRYNFEDNTGYSYVNASIQFMM